MPIAGWGLSPLHVRVVQVGAIAFRACRNRVHGPGIKKGRRSHLSCVVFLMLRVFDQTFSAFFNNGDNVSKHI